MALLYQVAQNSREGTRRNRVPDLVDLENVILEAVQGGVEVV